MSVQSEINRIKGSVSNAYTALSAKGATIPTTKNVDSLSATIMTVPTGITPTGSISITANGTYDVTQKASAVVNVPYIEYGCKCLDDSDNQYNVQGIGAEAYKWLEMYSYPVINLPVAKSIGAYAFESCMNLTAVNLTSATDIGDYAFSYNQDLEYIFVGAVSSVGQDAFSNCVKVADFTAPTLTQIGQNAFGGMTNLVEMYLGVTSQQILDNAHTWGIGYGYANPCTVWDVDGNSVVIEPWT